MNSCSLDERVSMSLSQGFLGDAEEFFNQSDEERSRLLLAKYFNKEFKLGLSWQDSSFWDAFQRIFPTQVSFLYFKKLPPTQVLSEVLQDFSESRIGRKIRKLKLDWQEPQWVICRLPWVGGKQVGNWLGFHNLTTDPSGDGLVVSVNDNRIVGEIISRTVETVKEYL